MTDDEELRFEGASEFLSRRWRDLSKLRRAALVGGAAWILLFVVMMIVFPQVQFLWFGVGLPLAALIGGVVNRAEENRRLDEIVRRELEERPDDEG
jgi:hypothetical protein